MQSFIVLISFLMFSIQVFAEPNYVIEAEILNGDKVIATPKMIVASGVNAAAAVEGNYELTLNATAVKEDMALIKTKLEIDEKKHTPSMVVELGKKAKVSIGDHSLVLFVKEAH